MVRGGGLNLLSVVHLALYEYPCIMHHVALAWWYPRCEHVVVVGPDPPDGIRGNHGIDREREGSGGRAGSLSVPWGKKEDIYVQLR